jgi:RNA polymerase sigma-70 factor (ECF subfamily)
MQRAEKEILRAASQGDTEAFEKIVRKYQNLVYATAAQITRDPAAAQDIAQEAFVTAYSRLSDLRSEEAFPSWLRAIARNAALAWRKRQGRNVPLDDASSLHLRSGGPEDAAEREVERIEADAFQTEIHRIVSSLSDTLRFPVVLCYLDGVSTREAARFLGISEGAVRKRLHDGKKKLQERIVKMSVKTLQEYRLPKDFAKRCICGCQRAKENRAGRRQAAKPEKNRKRK